MYLKSFTAKNLKCFKDVTLTMPDEGGYAGWHVILGGNGVGKSTLLQGIALSSMEDVAASVLSWRSRFCLLYTSPSPRDRTRSRMPSSA